MTDIRRIDITGPFTDDEISRLCQVLRDIDNERPAAAFLISITEIKGSMDDGKALLLRMFPERSDRSTAISRLAYRNENYPERPCDYCEKPYRGPAVYCSFECAIADA